VVRPGLLDHLPDLGRLIAVTVAGATRTRPLLWSRPPRVHLALASGLIDATANACYVLATRAGLLDVFQKRRSSGFAQAGKACQLDRSDGGSVFVMPEIPASTLVSIAFIWSH